MHKNQKGITHILVLLVLVIGLSAGAYYYLAQQKPTEPSPTQTPTATQVEDWKTYTNREHGFEFKYPPDLYVNHYQESPFSETWSLSTKELSQEETKSLSKDSLANNVGIFISFQPQNTIKNYESYHLRLDNYRKGDNIIIDGKDASSLISTTIDNKEVVEYIMEFNDGILGIQGFSQGEEGSVLTQILSTFRFLDEEKADTSSWITYTNTQFGYSLKYPPNWYLSKESEHLGQVYVSSYDTTSGFRGDGSPPTNEMIIDIYTNPKDENYSIEKYSTKLREKYTTKIDGQEALKGYYYVGFGEEDLNTSQYNTAGHYSYATIFERRGYFYYIAARPSSSKLIDYYTQILSTFEFTE